MSGPLVTLNTPIQHGIQRNPGVGNAGMVDRHSADNGSVFSRTARDLFGNAIALGTRQQELNVGDTHESSAHAVTGIPYTVSGTAVVINQYMQAWLSSFEDPIHLILGTAFHSSRTVIITREDYIGGGATVIPERGQGKGISKKESSRKVFTIRIGNNFSMNLNMFLIPAKAKREFTDYLNLQKLQ